jgi:hypothetical protein
MSFKFHVATRIRTFADQLGIDYEYIKMAVDPPL